jgi:short-subunit dehydrogenase
VTGASAGIGRATAVALAQHGAHVALAARSTGPLRETARLIESHGREALVVPTDVTRHDQVRKLIAATLDRWSRIDILICNAGEYIRSSIADLTVADVERSMAVNFYSALYSVLEVLPQMRRQAGGHIVLVSTMDAKKALPLDAPYVAAKSALTGFGEVLRQEVQGDGVHVSTIFPGRVDTAMIETLRVPWISKKITSEAVARAIIRAIRKRRLEVILPAQAIGLDYLNTLSPRLGDWATRYFHLEGWESKHRADTS